ncbi:type VII secretion protein EccE [Amycolatopsis endophytica]|uniref:Type VII secretion protein EccE n=1 Tax=Amycolatopsis endophytica TaxID=860233 RepID=A0A853B536_9PSEU|nr:type VII secretion protein EccE [Amycolatopsis endophytica]NYI90318.1 type VII secretion protein EccE [Amycolatopsis endophytica]
MTAADAGVSAGGGTGPRAPRTRRITVAPFVLPISFAQIAVWECALIAVLLAVQGVLPAKLVVTALALVVVAGTSVRFAGRHLAGWALTWVSYRLLQHDERRQAADPLRVLAHDFRLRQHVDRAGNRFGVAGVGDGWTAVIRLRAGVEPDVARVLDLLRAACENPEIPLSGAQLLVRTSFGERTYLVAVRFREHDAPLAALARGGGEPGELRATTRAALALMGALAKAGYGSTLLEAGELATELRASLGTDFPSRTPITDGWRSWSAGGVTQAGFAPLTREDVPVLLTTTSDGAALTVTSYTLRRNRFGRLTDEVTLRLARYAGSRRPPRTRDLGVPVVPLYGRHASAVRRTLPLALPG